MVGLEEKSGEKVKYLSGGMKRRLSIAISQIGNPKVIILDEPTTGLDPIQCDAIMKLLEKVKKERLMILTTHSMEEAEYLGDRVLILREGEVLCVNSALKIKKQFCDEMDVLIYFKESGERDLFLQSIRY